jgi:TPR repeat protein
MNKDLKKAIELYSQARDILDNILDQKFIQNNMYYYQKKGIGSNTLQKLKNQREHMQITTLINIIEKMDKIENEPSK